MIEGTRRIRKVRWALTFTIIVSLLILLIQYHRPQSTSTKFTQVSIKTLPWLPNPFLSWKKAIIHGYYFASTLKNKIISPTKLKKISSTLYTQKYLNPLLTDHILFLNNKTKTKQMMTQYPIDDSHTFYLYPDNKKFNSDLDTQPSIKHLTYKAATIEHSFAKAALKIGLTQAQIQQVSHIFSSNIDFTRDIHVGDRFSILYNKHYRHSKKGPIIVATFTNRGHTYKALRFTYPNYHSGYYTPEGHSITPLFLRKPLKYKRISGYFSLHRYDPVLHIVHPHLGIDFAAPMGTKIKSIGHGTVIFQGRKGGYGNAVIIRYNRKYKALYGHMSRFATHQHVGSTVKKGQVIGYVGRTGWATGPHLHFEIYVYGIPKNPLTMKLTDGKSIPKHYLPTFHKTALRLLAELKKKNDYGNK